MGKLQSLKGKLFYGVGAVGLDLSYGMFYSFLNKYLTDVLKLKANFLLILTPIARIWDGINDPMMGTIVDNTHTKMGKYRPWILRGSILNAVVLALLFNNPGIPTAGVWIYAYIAVLYIGWGMTNTLADIPYWSMVPSFTTDPKERSLIATIARTFSGLGQGIITIGAPLAMKFISVTVSPDGSKVWDTRSFSVISLIAAAGLVFFAGVSVLKTKETVYTSAKEKFSFKKILNIAKNNDQLRTFMLFAMISNAGFYMISGVGVYYFDVCAGDASLQGMFNTFGAVGSIVGLAVIPVGLKFTTRRRIYQFSLGLAAFGFFGMLFSAKVLDSMLALYIFNLLAQTGTAAMFVSQTVFLADIVDYGEVKMGYRAESVTFSMKGFLQKMAYTLQTVILYAGIFLTGYDSDLHAGNSAGVKTAFDLMMLVIPAVFMLISLLIFTFRFKLHGKYMEEITAEVTRRREEREQAGSAEA
ncbi:MAG: MFS transporter [Clostridia bacterium]|nr:MFS transporter [Clostridia bacterium]